MGIQLHDLVAGEFLHVCFCEAQGAVRVIELDKVRALAQVIQFKLHLGGEDGQQRVPVDDFSAAKHQLMEFEGAVTLFVHVHLQGLVKGVHGELVVVGEGYYIVAQAFIYVVRLLGPGFGLVERERALDPCVGVEVGPLPALDGIQGAVGVVDVGAAEGPGFPEAVDGAYAGDQQGHQQEQRHGGHRHVQDMKEFFHQIFLLLARGTRTRRAPGWTSSSKDVPASKGSPSKWTAPPPFLQM